MADSSPKKQQPKHRACDECRSRKLACSKQPDGCDRCKKEGIVCHYSPQKQMGRPRKRPCPDTDTHEQKAKQQLSQEQYQFRSATADADSNTSSGTPISSSAPSGPLPTTTSAPTETFGAFDSLSPLDDLQVPTDLDWSPFDSAAGDMSFLDYMNLDPNQPFDPAFVPPDALSLTFPVEEQKPMSKWRFGIGGLFDGETFDMLSLAMDDALPSNDSLPSPSHETSSAIAPSLTSDSSHSSPADNPSPMSPSAPPRSHTPCVCLANMYLALDRLQVLPSGVRDAMCAARYGARVAHDCMQCPSCSLPVLTEIKPPIQSLQNLLILGALLPVIANAYMHIVPLVDEEARKAKAERRKLFFSIPDFGGMWGRMADQKACQTTEALQGDMEPELWRQIVRAMLKLDVYGMDDCGPEGDKFQQIGLRDVVDQMEERSIKRHNTFEHPDVQAAVRSINCPQQFNPGSSDKPTCFQIIGIAKQAIESIVIA